jgi:hypothetical protein
MQFQNGLRTLNYIRQCRRVWAQLQAENCLGPLNCIRKWPRTSHLYTITALHFSTALENGLTLLNCTRRSQTSQMHQGNWQDLLIGLDSGFRPLNCARKWPQTSKLHPRMALHLDSSPRTASDLSMALENDLGPIKCPENGSRLLKCMRDRPHTS